MTRLQRNTRLTVVIHSAVFVERGQVETLAEAVAVPYLNPKNNHETAVRH